MGDLNAALLSVNNLLFVGLVLLSVWGFRTRQMDISAQAALVAWIVDDLLTLVLTVFLYRAFEDVTVNRTMFYLSLAALATMSLLFIAVVHSNSGKHKASPLAKLIAAALSLMVFLTIMRYFDRVIFELDALELVYRYGVLSIKVCALPILLTYIMKYPRRFELVN